MFPVGLWVDETKEQRLACYLLLNLRKSLIIKMIPVVPWGGETEEQRLAHYILLLKYK